MRFLTIGHLTRDLLDESGSRSTLGGTVSYAGIAAQRLGAEVTILTRSQPTDAQNPLLQGIQVINLGSAHTTTFRNVYREGVRSQRLAAVAGPIFAGDLPDHALATDICLLAPLAQEVDPAIVGRINGLVGATPQGWMREWDERGRVQAAPWRSAGRVLPHLDALILSDADLTSDPGALAVMLHTVPLVVITKGAAGCILYVNGRYQRIPARPANEVDPTGAGDVFAAAFLIHLHESRNPLAAARFANVAASMSVEIPGVAGIPDRAAVEAYLAGKGRPGNQ